MEKTNNENKLTALALNRVSAITLPKDKVLAEKTKQIISCLENETYNALEKCVVLNEVYSKELWSNGNEYESFEKYVKDIFTWSKQLAYEYVHTAKFITKDENNEFHSKFAKDGKDFSVTALRELAKKGFTQSQIKECLNNGTITLDTTVEKLKKLKADNDDVLFLPEGEVKKDKNKKGKDKNNNNPINLDWKDEPTVRTFIADIMTAIKDISNHGYTIMSTDFKMSIDDAVNTIIERKNQNKTK